MFASGRGDRAGLAALLDQRGDEIWQQELDALDTLATYDHSQEEFIALTQKYEIQVDGGTPEPRFGTPESWDSLLAWLPDYWLARGEGSWRGAARRGSASTNSVKLPSSLSKRSAPP